MATLKRKLSREFFLISTQAHLLLQFPLKPVVCVLWFAVGSHTNPMRKVEQVLLLQFKDEEIEIQRKATCNDLN